MTKEAAHTLFIEFLAMREIAVPAKKLLQLLTWAQKAGYFKSPSSVFDVTEWREVGEGLWEKTIDGSKEAKELGLVWREVVNHLKQYKAEKKVALAAQQFLDADEDHSGQSRLFKTVPVASGAQVPVLENATKVSEAAGTTHSSASTVEADGPSCRPKTPKTTPLPDSSSSSSSSSDSDSDNDIARKKRVRNYKSPSAPSYRPPPFAPPPPPAGITDNLKALSLGTDAVIESGGGLVLRPKGNGQWSGVVRDALLEGDWVASGAIESTFGFPVVHEHNAQGQLAGIHRPFEWKLFQQPRSTVTQYGLHSEPWHQMLSYIFSSQMLSANDCMALAKMVCTPAQYLHWEKLWKAECRKIVNAPPPQADPLHAIQLDMLLGQGQFAATPVQMQFPAEFHRASAEAAHKALLRIPLEKKGPNWGSIRQNDRESYEHYVNRLVEALDLDADLQGDMKENLLKTLAFENVNPKTRLLLSTLPKDAPLADTLERVARAEAQTQNVLLAEAIGAAVKEQNQPVAEMLQELPS